MTEINKWLPHGRGHNDPKLIVVHCMAEYLDTNDDGADPHAIEFLDHIGISAHILVSPDGEVYRCRYDNEVAWHAGKDKSGHNYNPDSLGIEFLVPGTHTYPSFFEVIKHPYISEIQYQSGKAVILKWIKKYGIEQKNFVRHSDICPSRKIDPGDGFQWTRLVSECYPEN